MCGIAGVLHGTGRLPDPAVLESMAAAIAHRGPDGTATATSLTCGMATTRLALVDPSPAGDQPWTADGKLLGFNGEIYNHRSLRRELEDEGVTFAGRCDTEVLFHLLDRRGPDGALRRLEGMFAFAWWDGSSLALARDRFGIKPLLWTVRDDRLHWASEAKALRHATAIDPDPTAALFSLLAKADRSIERTPFLGVNQLPPGHVLRVRPGEAPTIDCYFELRDVVDEEAHRELAALDGDAVTRRLGSLLSRAVDTMVVADAPMGTFLSGGVDSSLISSLAVRRDADHQLFTADIAGRTEAPRARQAADWLGRQVTTAPMTADDVLADWAEATWHYETPIVTHMNALPLHRVARTARESGVKAVLTGEGADELFLGYSDTAFRPYRRVLRSPITALRSAYGLLPGLAERVLPEIVQGEERYVANLAEDFEQRRTESLAREAFAFLSPRQAASQATSIELFASHLQTLLHRNDRMGMQASIECRFPFLDSELVQFGVNLPVDHKLQWTTSLHDRKHPFLLDKAPVRALASDQLPRSVALRKKDGFPAYGHHDMRVDAGLFIGGWAADALHLTRAGIQHLSEHESPYFAAKLASVEIFGRLFGAGESAADITDDLRRAVTLTP